jgi:hypothetical protein
MTGKDMGDMRDAYKILIRKHEDNTPLKRQRCSWEDNIKMDLKQTGGEDMDCTHLAQHMAHPVF